MKFKIIPSEKGLTLTELIVASVVVGIVMVGVASFTASIKNVQDTAITGSRIQLELSSAVSLMRKDFGTAVGDLSDFGIGWDNTLAGGTALCSRVSADSNSTYSTPVWVCWYAGPNAADPLRRCASVPLGNLPGAGGAFDNTDCNAATGGTLDFFPLSQKPFYTMVPMPVALTTFPPFLTIDLRSSRDPSVGSDPMDNPEHSIQTNIALTSHSKS